MADFKNVDLFGIPDALINPVVMPKKRAPKKNVSEKSDKLKKSSSVQPTPSKSAVNKPNAAASAANLPGQGFLPGLSRRGRPRLAKPVSAVERTAEHRRKRIVNGAKRVEIILDSEVSKALDRLAEHHQEPKSDVIATLIRKAATRLKG
jgi:hypothetical protein